MKYALYFIIGGTVVSLTTYLGSLGRSWLAAFVTTFPALTGITFILMYLNAGSEPTVPYARNLLYFVVPWLAYVGFYLLTIDRQEVEAHIGQPRDDEVEEGDRKSTRLNSSHLVISYAVFCLKKKKRRRRHHRPV